MYYIAKSTGQTTHILEPFNTAQEAITSAQKGGIPYEWKLLKEVPIVADEDPVDTWRQEDYADQWSEKDLEAMEKQQHPAIKMLKKAPCEICGKPVIPCEGEITMCNDCKKGDGKVTWLPKGS